MFHCVCFNINIDYTILADRATDSKTEWLKDGDEQRMQYTDL